MDLKQEIKLSDLLKRGPGKRKPQVKDNRRPAPREILGLKIGSASLTAAHVVNNGSKKVVKMARAPLPAGIVNGGEVRDSRALGETLVEFFAANSLPRRGVRIGLGNSRIGVRLIEVAGIDDRIQLDNAIRFRAHEMLSTSLDDAVIDYQLVGNGVDETGATTHRVLLVVAYRESINRYLTAADAAKLDVFGIDLEAFALLRAAAAPSGERTPDSALAVVSIDHDRTTFAVSDGAVCHFTRVLEWGDSNIQAALARAPQIGTADEPGDVAGDASPGSIPAQTSARNIVAHEVATLARELNSSLRFYQSQPGALPVGVVLLSGALTGPDVSRELGALLDVELRLADPFARVELAHDVAPLDRPHELTVAIGLGIED